VTIKSAPARRATRPAADQAASRSSTGRIGVVTWAPRYPPPSGPVSISQSDAPVETLCQREDPDCPGSQRHAHEPPAVQPRGLLAQRHEGEHSGGDYRDQPQPGRFAGAPEREPLDQEQQPRERAQAADRERALPDPPRDARATAVDVDVVVEPFGVAVRARDDLHLELDLAARLRARRHLEREVNRRVLAVRRAIVLRDSLTIEVHVHADDPAALGIEPGPAADRVARRRIAVVHPQDDVAVSVVTGEAQDVAPHRVRDRDRDRDQRTNPLAQLKRRPPCHPDLLIQPTGRLEHSCTSGGGVASGPRTRSPMCCSTDFGHGLATS
jgi:hypothetical protein